MWLTAANTQINLWLTRFLKNYHWQPYIFHFTVTSKLGTILINLSQHQVEVSSSSVMLNIADHTMEMFFVFFCKPDLHRHVLCFVLCLSCLAVGVHPPTRINQDTRASSQAGKALAEFIDHHQERPCSSFSTAWWLRFQLDKQLSEEAEAMKTRG